MSRKIRPKHIENENVYHFALACEGAEDKLSMYRRSAIAINRNANIVL